MGMKEEPHTTVVILLIGPIPDFVESV